MSLDGVIQAPGGPEEDRSGNFPLGGWMSAFDVDDVELSVAGFDGKDRDLILGRKTYEIFEAYWPFQGNENPIARNFNAAKKYVASRSLKSLDWNNSSVLGGDISHAVRALKEEAGKDLQVIGSSTLAQALHCASLIDGYHLWTFPLVLGQGKRLFEGSLKPSSLRLISSKISGTGVIMSTYIPAGEVQLGSVGPPFEPSAKELARRQKVAHGLE